MAPGLFLLRLLPCAKKLALMLSQALLKVCQLRVIHMPTKQLQNSRLEHTLTYHCILLCLRLFLSLYLENMAIPKADSFVDKKPFHDKLRTWKILTLDLDYSLIQMTVNSFTSV